MEDEIVQIMERPTMAGCRPLARATAREFVAFAKGEAGRGIPGGRMNLMRDTQKRLLRVFPMLAINFLSDPEIEKMVRATLAESALLLRRSQDRDERTRETGRVVGAADPMTDEQVFRSPP
jgi:hypothetical protein